MPISLATIVGLLAGCLATYSFVPQVVKCWRTGDAAAVSLKMFALRSFGLVTLQLGTLAEPHTLGPLPAPEADRVQRALGPLVEPP